MLSVSPLTSPIYEVHEKGKELPAMPVGADGFLGAFAGGNLLDDIDFDDLFTGIDEGDILPDLEVDLEMFTELSVSGSDVNASSPTVEKEEENEKEKEEKRDNGKKAESRTQASVTNDSASSEPHRGRKPLSAQDKSAQGKRKVKVDWTADLHRRFVQAVEQLGVDKAVPSRILELMGIDCLTRHNIASHLQKYRSHRKHLLARETEAANWTQRRQIYGGHGGGCSGGSKREMSPWVVPTIGFPPSATLPPFRPLHVWGHPTSVDQSLVHVWPKQLVHSPSSPLPPPWAGAPPPPSYWHPRGPKDGWAPNHVLMQPTHCFPQPMTMTRFSSPLVPSIPSHPLYRADNCIAISRSHIDSHLHFDFNPSKETIDAAIEDVLAKPWLPLPLGLKPPSVESVLVELQRQEISKVPHSCVPDHAYITQLLYKINTPN